MYLLVHAEQRVVVALQVAGKLPEGRLHQGLHVESLLLGDSGREAESLDAAADADPHGLDGSPGVDVADDLVGVHVGGVGEVRLKAMVLQDDGLEDVLEVLVGVGIAGVDAAVLVVEVDGASDGLEVDGVKERKRKCDTSG